ncbi:hypothetical protein Tco_1100972 [Tanacetum coccineum]
MPDLYLGKPCYLIPDITQKLFGISSFSAIPSQEVPPLDFQELLACLVSFREPSILEGDNINDELDLRLESVLQSTGHHYEGELWDDLPKRDQIKGVFGIAYLNCLLGSDI